MDGIPGKLDPERILLHLAEQDVFHHEGVLVFPVAAKPLRKRAVYIFDESVDVIQANRQPWLVIDGDCCFVRSILESEDDGMPSERILVERVGLSGNFGGDREAGVAGSF